jgi:xylulokinase
MADKLLIGIDIGTSSVKAVLATADGRVLDRFGSDTAMARDTPAAAEQNPETWLMLVEAALSRFSAHPRAAGVAGIGITSQVNTHVFCGADLQALRPAITWQDTRAGGAAAALDARISPDRKIAALGAPIPIDASHALARMAWMATSEPAHWRATAHVLSPKDYVIARLTGAVVADPLASVGLTGLDLRYADAVLDLVPRAAEVLPGLRDPLDVAGTMRAGLPFAGVPVAVGTMDAWASMFGLGVAQAGQAMYLSGTSEVLGLISDTRAGTPGVVTFPHWRGLTLHAGPTQSGGASLAWLSRLIGRDVTALSDLAAAAPITVDSPVFLPHLDGERAPLWDPDSRGGFAGLSSRTGPEALAASVMEGVAFSARMAIEALAQSGADPMPVLRHGGGGAVSDIWCQIRANALGRSLDRVAMADPGASGAMAMAGVAVGQFGDLGTATAGLIAVDRRFDPVPEAAALADQRYAAFKALYPALGTVIGPLTSESK